MALVLYVVLWWFQKELELFRVGESSVDDPSAGIGMEVVKGQREKEVLDVATSERSM